MRACKALLPARLCLTLLVMLLDAAACAKSERLAQRLLALHRQPPLVLANAWDGASARAVASMEGIKALATASFAIAAAHGLSDAELDLETNLAVARVIGAVARQHNLPFTVDLQHGYGDRLEEAIERAIEAGAHGCNLEDLLADESDLLSSAEACSRIQRARSAAIGAGVPSFVLNARCDALNLGQPLDVAVQRIRSYLAAGASVAFVWRKGPGLTADETTRLVAAVPAGRFCSQAWPGGLCVREMAAMGVGRVSVGPGLLHESDALIARRTAELLAGGAM